MKIARLTLGLIAALAIGACSDSGAGPSETFHSIAGEYGGGITGFAQGISMEAVASLSIQQTQGNVSGSYAIAGILTDGVEYVDFVGTGTLSGTIASGNNPSVNIAITPAFCPNRTANFSGAYDSNNQRLTITGPVQFFDSSCAVVISYPTTIVLSK